MLSLLISITLVALVSAANKNDVNTTTLAPVTTPSDQESTIERSIVDPEPIMAMCNDSFRIEMAYLESLNQTGSFVDETDKTPKCFLRCVLENLGILSEDHQIDPALAAVYFAGKRNGKTMDDIGDMTALCAERTETCACEKSYMFLRCLMSMEIERYEKPE